MTAAQAATIRELLVRLALHHFGDHSDECDECGTVFPSDDALQALQPLRIVSSSGGVLNRSRADKPLAELEGA